MRIGYIGLGNMGGALARRLQLSRQLTVYDRNAQAARALELLGAEVAESSAALARDCEVIFLCLPKSQHVREAIWGDSGMIGALRPGTRIIDQTSGDPRDTREMAATLALQGVVLFDAPVSGGPVAADAGTIAIMVGADKADYDAALPLLDAISPKVFHAGAVGAGHTMKLVNNLLSGAQRLLTLECVALAAKCGIAPVDAINVLRAGGARNVFLEKGIEAIVDKGDLDGGFSLELMLKDIDLACRLGRDHAMPMPFGATTREMYRLSMRLVGENRGINSVATAMERLAGVEIVRSDPAA